MNEHGTPTCKPEDDENNLAIVKFLNRKHYEEFRKIPYGERILLIPHCMRNVDHCKAESTKEGYICAHCGACNVSDIKRSAEKLGYNVFVVPGGRMVHKILRRTKPKAAVGIACSFELAEAMEKVSGIGIPCQGILLAKDGCRNTCVNKESTIQFLHLNGHKVGAIPELDENVVSAEGQET